MIEMLEVGNMKLYYSKGACSLAPHIVLQELGIPFETVSVDWSGKSGEELSKLNPMGAVPTLVLDDGQSLTEGAAIVQYLADLKPSAKLAPANGTPERYRLQEALNFIASELHKGFNPLFTLDLLSKDPAVQGAVATYAKADLGRKFDVVSQKLGDRTTLLPSGYSVADAYLFTVLTWTGFVGIDLKPWPTLTRFMDTMRARPAVQAAMKAEHII